MSKKEGVGGTILSSARVDDLGGSTDSTAGATESLNSFDDIVSAGNLAENNVLAIEPAGLDGGDEELGAVAINKSQLVAHYVPILLFSIEKEKGLRVGTSVGHGEKTGLFVSEVEVLVSELLAVDGFTTGTLMSQWSVN